MASAFLPFATPLIPLLLAVLAPGFVRARPGVAAWTSAVSLWAGAAFVLHGMSGGATHVLEVEWMPQLGVDLALRVTPFGAWFGVLILGLGGCILLYACSYFAKHSGLPYLAGCLALFTLVMLGIVISDNVYLLFLFWEGTSLISFLLVGFHDRDSSVRAKAAQALLVTLLGGAALLAGLILMHGHFGTPSIAGMLDQAGSGAVGSLSHTAVALVMLGAMTKSAQWPFHFWLPNAMAGPTPVSAFLHSATMVKAGVFLLALFAPLLAPHPLWTPVLVTSGLLTVIVSVARAARSDDMKAVLASTTLSALGFLTVLAGVGTKAALLGFTIFLTAHALYKAPLFLAAGNLEKRFGSRNFSELGGAFRHLPWTAAALAVSVVSLLGLPPLPGFLGKEYMLEGLMKESGWLAVITALVAAGMAALGLQLARPLFANREARKPVTAVPTAMTVATVLPVLGSLALAFEVPFSGSSRVSMAAEALGAPADYDFKLWHGFTPVLGLSALVLALGFGLWRLFRAPRPLFRGLRAIFEPAFEGGINALRRAGDIVSRWLDHGSLGTQLGVMIAAIGLPAIVSLAAHGLPVPELSFGGGESALLVLGPLIGVAALSAATTKHTLTLLVSLGFVGLSIAFWFLWFSAPDLALTQLLAETLLLFLLAGVLYRNNRDGEKTRRPVLMRGVVALTAGAVVTLMILKSMASQWGAPISEFHLAYSKSAAFGANVVNVILVDFRALDTLGEILVLAIAALGSTAALGPARPRSPLPGRSDTVWLKDGSRVVIALLLPVAAWVFWRGHNAPGGGFISGLVAASAIGLAGLCQMSAPTSRHLAHGSHRLILTGLSLALIAAVVPVFDSRPFFTGLWLHVGDQHFGTPLLFDLGVFLTVLGFATRYLRHFQPNPLSP